MAFILSAAGLVWPMGEGYEGRASQADFQSVGLGEACGLEPGGGLNVANFPCDRERPMGVRIWRMCAGACVGLNVRPSG